MTAATQVTAIVAALGAVVVRRRTHTTRRPDQPVCRTTRPPAAQITARRRSDPVNGHLKRRGYGQVKVRAGGHVRPPLADLV